ncbi:putative quinol monooxygenase [Actinomadura rupiterrae]|uniref:putative quinol monooxygenase n=1 Tax=Actinomadura rupiterrae TaxID=559627 RepID=UPI0020A2BC88|nr:antibiotic biosynthesis monooxygenase family protein [Actinomadura rupiterrae]MCP2343827.1 quinol monooxygenase YgiN [Actinomadura rupiterrae]
MAVHHVVTIHVAPGRADEFAAAFNTLRSAVQQEEGCEQYELFQSLDAPDKLVILERWTDQALLDRHQEVERTQYTKLIEPLMKLWAPGDPPSVARYETP